MNDNFDFDLPEGKTCFDCVNFHKCYGKFAVESQDKTCDLFPNRFHDKNDKTNIRGLANE